MSQLLGSPTHLLAGVRSLILVSLTIVYLATQAAEVPTTIREEIRGLVAGAGPGQAIDITILPRETLPGARQQVVGTLQSGGSFIESVDLVPGLSDIVVAYGGFTKTSRVRTVIDTPEVLIRLDWSGGGTASRCQLLVDEMRPLDATAQHAVRRQLSATSEFVYYPIAGAGLYPMWVFYSAGTGNCTATVTVYLNGRQILSRQQAFTQSNSFNPLIGEGWPGSNKSAWHVGTVTLSSGTLVGSWDVVDPAGVPAWIGRRTMAQQGSLLNAGETNAGRIAAAVFPLGDYTLQSLEGANGTGDVTLTFGQSTIVRAYGLVEDVRRSENKAQELLGLTRLQTPSNVGILDARGVFTALAPGTVQVTAADRKGTTRSITITVTGDGADSDGDGLPDATETLLATNSASADSDADGIGDAYEIRNQLNPWVKDASEDRDNDGLINSQEAQRGTSAYLLDSDADRISDGQEIAQGSVPTTGGDGDNDGLSDAAEIYIGTSPTSSDTDGDFVNDGIEVARGTNPNAIKNFPAAYDLDNDGLTSLREQWINAHLTELGYAGTSLLSINLWDSDGDLLTDGFEALQGLDPTRSNRTGNTYSDTDGDAVNEFDEQIFGTNPSNADTDGDGTSDGEEVNNGTDPTDPSDGGQFADSDGDGITDAKEIQYQTDPNNPDTDGDGTSDGTEVAQGYNPTDSTDHPGDANGPSTPIEPHHYTRVKLNLEVGDPSGSHSERWRLQVGSIGYVSPDFGVVGNRDFDTFQRGNTYPITVQHVASNVSPPDYDWHALVNQLGGTKGWTQGTTTVYNKDKSQSKTGSIVIYDQDTSATFSLLQPTEYHGDNTDITIGKIAYVILPYGRIHGPGSEDKRFPRYAPSLMRRTGTVVDPVIQMNSGGDKSTSNCSLYGCVSNSTNTWNLTAVANYYDHTARPSTYTIEWSGLPGGSYAGQETINVTLPAGRYTPSLIVRRQGVEVGRASIHSIVVEAKPGNRVARAGTTVEKPFGSKFALTHKNNPSTTPKEFNLDFRLGTEGGTERRARISLDGYPQNEYWVTAGDVADLAQVDSPDAGQTEYFVQGYMDHGEDASQLSEGITTFVDSGWFVSNEEVTSSDKQKWERSDEGKIQVYTYDISAEETSDGVAFTSGFTDQASPIRVSLTSIVTGQPIPGLSVGQSTISVPVEAQIEDLYGKLTGSLPTVKINGQPVAVSGANGVYTASGIVQLSLNAGLVRVLASNGAGSVGGREFAVVQAYDMEQFGGGVAFARNEFFTKSVVSALQAAGPNPPANPFIAVVYRGGDLWESGQTAKRISMTIPEVSSGSYNTTSYTGQSKSLSFTRSANGRLVTPTMYFDPAASGTGNTMSSWPLIWEGTGDPHNGDKVNLPDDFMEMGDKIKVYLNGDPDGAKIESEPLWIPRLLVEAPTEANNGVELVSGTDVGSNGRKVEVYIPFLMDEEGSVIDDDLDNGKYSLGHRTYRTRKEAGAANPRSVLVTVVDKRVLAYIRAVAATFDGQRFSDKLNLTNLLADDPNANVAHIGQLGEDISWEIQIPWSLRAWKDLGRGVFDGSIEMLVENGESLLAMVKYALPWEFAKLIGQMASLDWSSMQPGDYVAAMFKESFVTPVKEAFTAARTGDWYNFGLKGIRAIVNYATMWPGSPMAAVKVAQLGLKAGGAALNIAKRGIQIPARAVTKWLHPKVRSKPIREENGPHHPEGADFPNFDYGAIVEGKRGRCRAVIAPEDLKRNANPPRNRYEITTEVRNDLNLGNLPELDGDGWVAGHLVADQLGGRPDLPANFVPMTASANRKHLDIENKVAKLGYDGKVVTYEIVPDYTNPPHPYYATHVPPIPSRIKVTYVYNDPDLPNPVKVDIVIENTPRPAP